MLILGFHLSGEDQALIAGPLSEVSASALVEATSPNLDVLLSLFDAADDLALPIVLGSEDKLGCSVFDVDGCFHDSSGCLNVG